MLFNTLDLTIVAIYCIGIIGLATYVSRQSSGHERSAEDYFLAGRSLPWWAIGASLIAANISAEQIIGMSGQGFVVGMAIATYELTAAIALIVMAKFFLPLFLEKKIYTMPQFLEQRFDKRVSLVLSFFWLAIYIFINLTSVLWLGSLAINALTGIDLFYGLVLLAGLSLAYSLWGGLKAVALTDIIQVVLLIFGGLAVSYIALTTIGDGKLFSGLVIVYNEVPEKFDMILSTDNPAYKSSRSKIFTRSTKRRYVCSIFKTSNAFGNCSAWDMCSSSVSCFRKIRSSISNYDGFIASWTTWTNICCSYCSHCFIFSFND